MLRFSNCRYRTVSHGLLRRAVAETVGTAMLLAAVVGSGIMGERLSGGNVAIALLANTLATGAALVALILTFGPISGAHFNPAVSLADASQGGLAWREVPAYIFAQLLGAFAGVATAHLMFGLPLLSTAGHVRAGMAQTFSEFVATFGLLAVIWGCVRFRPQAVPFAVAAYISAAYWFTASTSFANPAVTLARSMSDTFVGIRPVDVPGFIGVEREHSLALALVPGLDVAENPHAFGIETNLFLAFAQRGRDDIGLAFRHARNRAEERKDFPTDRVFLERDEPLRHGPVPRLDILFFRSDRLLAIRQAVLFCAEFL